MRVILGVKKRREKKFLRVERNSNSSAGVPQLRRPPRTGGEGGWGFQANTSASRRAREAKLWATVTQRRPTRTTLT